MLETRRASCTEQRAAPNHQTPHNDFYAAQFGLAPQADSRTCGIGADYAASTCTSAFALAAARAAPTPPPPRHIREHERVKQAAIFCADSLSGGWQAAVAQRITDNAPTTWKRLSRSRRRHNCNALAQMARSILDAKNEIHKLAGQLSGKAASRFGLKGAARAFTEELVSNIPLKPIDAKMVAVARGIQITGILLCVMDNRDLTKCRCFIDLAVAESKERVNQILIAGMSDWTGLAQFHS
jgi:hypothetical protein